MTVTASFCMSLDGFVARPDNSVGPLFDWYSSGDVEVPMVGYPITFRVSAASAAYLQAQMDWARAALSFVAAACSTTPAAGEATHPGAGTPSL